MLSNPASRRVCTARRTSSGPARARARRAAAAGSSGRRARPASHRCVAAARRKLGRHGLRDSPRPSPPSAAGSAREQPLELRRPGEGRRPAAEEHGLHPARRAAPRSSSSSASSASTYPPVLVLATDERDEVAVAAAMRRRTAGGRRGGGRRCIERFFSESRLSTARNASCGTSTPPTCFMRFLPFFCFSSSLRLRRDVAAVALREHVLALRLDRLARDHPRADRRLDRRCRTSAAGSPRAASPRAACRGRTRNRGG